MAEGCRKLRIKQKPLPLEVLTRRDFCGHQFLKNHTSAIQSITEGCKLNNHTDTIFCRIGSVELGLVEFLTLPPKKKSCRVHCTHIMLYIFHQSCPSSPGTTTTTSRSRPPWRSGWRSWSARRGRTTTRRTWTVSTDGPASCGLDVQVRERGRLRYPTKVLVPLEPHLQRRHCSSDY